MLAQNYPHLSARVEFKLPADGEGEPFDIVLSFNSFEHYAEPEKFIWVMRRYMKPEGIMAIAFGPLWKSVWGGHIDYMTRFPWAHLLFPESVIMQERRRFRPDEQAESFAHIRGGLNKMTLQRYRRIISECDLEFVLFKTNVSRRKLIGVFDVLKRLPLCEEYFTLDVCSIMRQRPATTQAGAAEKNLHSTATR
jgi:SAM-dependent methyltransferase